MSILGMILGRPRQQPTITEGLMASIGLALSVAPQGSKATETLEAARLLAALQFTRIYSLDEAATLFVDRQTKDLFENDARVSEIVPRGASVVIEYPYRPTLKAKKVKHRMSAEEEATLPLRMGILIQNIGDRIYAGLIVGHRSGPKPPPVMFDISEITCPCDAPFWSASFTLSKLAISSFAGNEHDQGILNGFGQDLMEELAFGLAFLAIAESAASPFRLGAIHPSGFGPVSVRLPITQARRREEFCIARKLSEDSLISAPGWYRRNEVNVASKLAILKTFIEENMSDAAPAAKDETKVVQ